MLSVIILSVIKVKCYYASVIMLSVIKLNVIVMCDAECHYAERRGTLHADKMV